MVIAINNAVRLAPWADILLGGDLKWWAWNRGCPEFTGLKVTCHRSVAKVYPDVWVLRVTGLTGCEFKAGHVRTGGNSGYVAIQLAAQIQAKRIILLGYDMQPSADGTHHWHPPHVNNAHPNYARCLPRFATLVEPLAQAGIEVINCTPRTALTYFPHAQLKDVL